MTDPLIHVERAIRKAALIAVVAFVGAAAAAYYALPALFTFPTTLPEQLAFGAQASAVMMLCLFVAVGMVSTARRRSLEDVAGAAAGPPSPRIAVQAAFLQNTLEQTVLATVAYLAYASLYRGPWLALVVVAVVFFIVGRILFLRGYPHGAPGRALGMTLTLVPTGLLYLLVLVAIP